MKAPGHRHPDPTVAEGLLEPIAELLLQAVVGAAVRGLPRSELVVLVTGRRDAERYATSPQELAGLRQQDPRVQVMIVALRQAPVRRVIVRECRACAFGFDQLCTTALPLRGAFVLHYDLDGVRFSAATLDGSACGDA